MHIRVGQLYSSDNHAIEFSFIMQYKRFMIQSGDQTSGNAIKCITSRLLIIANFGCFTKKMNVGGGQETIITSHGHAE